MEKKSLLEEKIKEKSLTKKELSEKTGVKVEELEEYYNKGYIERLTDRNIE